MAEYESFSSLPPNEEATFVVFEKRTVEAAKTASMVGLGFAGGFFALILLVVIGLWGPIKKPWQEEIKRMLASGLKYELDALANKDFRYLTKTYLPRKLKEQDWLD